MADTTIERAELSDEWSDCEDSDGYVFISNDIHCRRLGTIVYIVSGG